MRLGKWMIIAAVTCAVALPRVAAAEPQAGSPVQKFGAPVTVKKAVNISKVQKSPAKFAGKTVRIEGTVKAVCQGMGCWVEVEGADGSSFIARSLDESVLLPKDCKGSRISVQGVITTMPTKKEAVEAEHQAATPHECPAPTYVLSTQGAELIARRTD